MNDHGREASTTTLRVPRRLGLRRALEMLQAGERINDELHRWTTAPRRLALQPVRSVS